MSPARIEPYSDVYRVSQSGEPRDSSHFRDPLRSIRKLWKRRRKLALTVLALCHPAFGIDRGSLPLLMVQDIVEPGPEIFPFLVIQRVDDFEY